MSKTRKKPAVPSSVVMPAGKHGGKGAFAKAKANPRLQSDNRWQRTKRYGWDSR